MTKAETVEELISYIEDRLSTLCRTDEDLSEEIQAQVDYDEEKLGLLKEWRALSEQADDYADQNRFEDSDTVDDRRIEIEEIFEAEYGLEFDSYGEINNS